MLVPHRVAVTSTHSKQVQKVWCRLQTFGSADIASQGPSQPLQVGICSVVQSFSAQKHRSFALLVK